jgi:excisionase family DNA binding protein
MVYSNVQMKDIITVSEAAKFLKKHPDTIRRYIEQKKLKARKISAGKSGVYVLLRNDLLEFIIADDIRKKSIIQKKVSHVKPVDASQEQLPM